MTTEIKSPINSNFSLPTPTFWIEYAKGDDVPENRLLLVRVFGEDGESQGVELVIYDPRVGAFLDVGNTAIEAFCTVSHYHLITDEDGDALFYGQQQQ